MTYFMGEFSQRQRLRKIRKVMREFKHGKLDNSYGGKVKNRKQAIAIALSEASKFSQQSAENAEFMWNPFKRVKYAKTWKMTKPKIFTKKNLAIGLGGLAATGLASYAGSKLYNRYQEKHKKWWEL